MKRTTTRSQLHSLSQAARIRGRPNEPGRTCRRPVVRGVAIRKAGPIPTQASKHLREYSCSYHL
jgi:hypothetical protein